MKKLGKLEINPERLMQKDDLKKLKGGWSGECAVNHSGGAFWKLVSWEYPGDGPTAEEHCSSHYATEENGAYCFCNYY